MTDNLPTARTMLHQDAWLCLLGLVQGLPPRDATLSNRPLESVASCGLGSHCWHCTTAGTSPALSVSKHGDSTLAYPADCGDTAIIDAGRGDVPVKDLRFRCTSCSSALTDFVVMSRDALAVQPGFRRFVRD